MPGPRGGGRRGGLPSGLHAHGLAPAQPERGLRGHGRRPLLQDHGRRRRRLLPDGGAPPLLDRAVPGVGGSAGRLLPREQAHRAPLVDRPGLHPPLARPRPEGRLVPHQGGVPEGVGVDRRRGDARAVRLELPLSGRGREVRDRGRPPRAEQPPRPGGEERRHADVLEGRDPLLLHPPPAREAGRPAGDAHARVVPGGQDRGLEPEGEQGRVPDPLRVRRAEGRAVPDGRSGRIRPEVRGPGRRDGDVHARRHAGGKAQERLEGHRLRPAARQGEEDPGRQAHPDRPSGPDRRASLGGGGLRAPRSRPRLRGAVRRQPLQDARNGLDRARVRLPALARGAGEGPRGVRRVRDDAQVGEDLGRDPRGVQRGDPMSATEHAEHLHAPPTTFFRKYVWSTDHKVIAKQYLFTAFFFLALGGLLAMVIRWQLAYPLEPVPVLGSLLKNTFLFDATGAVRPEGFNQAVTMHGTIMIFFVIIPILVGAFGNFLIPLHGGARDVAFPLLNALSYWLFLPAGLILFASFFVHEGPAAAGWTSYPPLSDLGPAATPGSGTGQVLWLFAIFFLGFSSILGGLNFLTTIIKMRAPGLTWSRLPPVTWAQLVTAIFQTLATPVLASATVRLPSGTLRGTRPAPPKGIHLK